METFNVIKIDGTHKALNPFAADLHFALNSLDTEALFFDKAIEAPIRIDFFLLHQFRNLRQLLHNLISELIQAFAAGGRSPEDRTIEVLKFGFKTRPGLSVKQIRLIENKPACALPQLFVIVPQFLFNQLISGAWRRLTFGRCSIQDLQEQTAAGRMAQEIVTQASAFSSPLNQSGKIRHDKTFIKGLDDAKLRLKGSKGIVGNLRPGVAETREQRGLARVGQADKPHIRDELQLQANFEFFSLTACTGKIRRLAHTVFKVDIAAATSPAFKQTDFLTILGEITDKSLILLLIDKRPQGQFQNEVGTFFTILEAFLAIFPIFSRKMMLKTKIDQGCLALGGAQNNAAPIAAIAPIRTTVRNIFFAAEGNRSISASAGTQGDRRMIEEHRKLLFYPGHAGAGLREDRK